MINLWCTKNLVDSQHFLGRLFDMNLKTPEYHLNYFTDPFDIQADIVFLNSCGFISSGRDEADATVKRLLKAGKTIYLMGCAVQYYKKLQKTGNSDKGTGNREMLKGVHYLSRGDMNTVNLKQIQQGYDSTSYGDFQFTSSPRVYTNLEQKFEYLKIAEWCDNRCTFCIIPQIRGKLRSRTIPDIVKEVENMITNWIKEIILIAQDTTRYGYDKYGKSALLTLLRRIDKIPGDFMYRILYLYPDVITLDHIKELKKLKKFIPYFDIPLQHISSPVLKRMGRFSPQPQKEQVCLSDNQVKRSSFWWLRNAGDLRNNNFTWNEEIIDFENDSVYDEWYITKFLDQIKKSFPVRFIRTNLIIGFPGETEKDFEQLMKFVATTKFDNIALFEYHDEPLAASSKLDKKVDDKVIRTRFTKIRQLVNRQLLDSEQARKGKEEIWYIMGIEQVTGPMDSGCNTWCRNDGQGGMTKKQGNKNKGTGTRNQEQATETMSVNLVVRPWLHCPEIDEYDEISLEKVIGTYEDKNELSVGDKIIYTV